MFKNKKTRNKTQKRKGNGMAVVYLITDGHGSYIRKDNYSNKFVPVRNVNLAERWKQRVKAANVLNNAICKDIRSQYRIVEVEEKQPVDSCEENNTHSSVNSANDIVKQITSDICDDSQMNKWQTGIETVKEFVQDAEARKNELSQALSDVDKEITDIHHYIELGRLNAYQGWLACNMLRSRLKRRRAIKDELMILTQLGECKVDSTMLGNINRAIAGLANRQYAPRVLTQLFIKE